MRTSDMKYAAIIDLHGKTLTRVFDCDRGWTEYRTKTKVPDRKFMPTFDLKFNGRTVLLLDNYGNDFMPDEVEKRLFGKNFSRQWLLGIDRASGELFSFCFYRVKKETVAVFSKLPSNAKVPKKYLTEKNLQYLRSCKRPWMCTWNHSDWLAFWDRDMTWDDFCSSMVIHLSLFPSSQRRGKRATGTGAKYLEVWGERHRIVTTWE